ncbi:hypothetical protein Bpla01_10380 [Burkholderia plantarii]|nr:hypothetical protein Bpla01_10380 [Burkholderia plantarii]
MAASAVVGWSSAPPQADNNGTATAAVTIKRFRFISLLQDCLVGGGRLPVDRFFGNPRVLPSG